jgi:predicted FMN-binding regulatory protein PaiB
VPLLLDAERGPLGTLVGHMARANPHWQSFDVRAPALAIFQGPHAYVSPRWFASVQRGVAAFEIPIERLEGKRKLSQNKPAADRAGVAAGLRAEGRADDVAIAAAMEALA